jgi:hypothetical protein
MEVLKQKDGTAELGAKLKVGNVLVTGPSGTGKTEFIQTLLPFTKRIYSLDKFAELDGDKWIIDLESIPTIRPNGSVYEGTSDNLGYIGAKLNLSCIVLLVPEIALWKAIQCAKYEEGVKQMLPKAWLDDWKLKSHWSYPKMWKHIRSKAALLSKHLPDVEVIYIEIKGKHPVKKGWF